MKIVLSLLGLFLFFHGISILAQVNEKQFEEIRKHDVGTISLAVEVIKRAIKTGDRNILENITVENFRKSPNYKNLRQKVGEYGLSFHYSNEIVRSEFLINEDFSQRLTIEFKKNKSTNRWFFKNAYLNGLDNPIPFPFEGFEPLSVSSDFFEFTEKINKNQLIHFSPILSALDIKSKDKILLTPLDSNKVYRFQDVLLHQEGKPKGAMYFTFQEFPPGHKDKDIFKSGWLLVDSGNMNNLYKQGENLYIDWLYKRDLELEPKENTEEERGILEKYLTSLFQTNEKENSLVNITCQNREADKQLLLSFQFKTNRISGRTFHTPENVDELFKQKILKINKEKVLVPEENQLNDFMKKATTNCPFLKIVNQKNNSLLMFDLAAFPGEFTYISYGKYDSPPNVMKISNILISYKQAKKRGKIVEIDCGLYENKIRISFKFDNPPLPLENFFDFDKTNNKLILRSKDIPSENLNNKLFKRIINVCNVNYAILESTTEIDFTWLIEEHLDIKGKFSMSLGKSKNFSFVDILY